MQGELKVAMIQSSLFWEDPERNRNVFSKKIGIVSTDTDLIVLPEMFTTGFTMSPENIAKEEGLITLKWMREKAMENNVGLIGSIPFYEDGDYANRLFFVLADGSYHQYDKRHTFTLAGEGRVYKAGKKKLIVDFKGFKICPLICYDLRFPVWARNTENYDILIYVANWPKPRVSAWDALLKARAIENMAYSIGVNRIGNDELGHEYSGHSATYDCLGRQTVFSKKEEIIYANLSKNHIVSTREKLKFLEDKDVFTVEE